MKALNKNILALAVATVVSGQVAAYEAGDFIVRAGYAAVDPRENSNHIKTEVTGSLPGTGAGVDGAAALGITGSYMLDSHWGVELLAATPFEHDIYSKGLSQYGIPDGRLGSTKQLPPTLSLQYYFAESNSALQPYAGVGVNYTIFFDESVSKDAKSTLGAENLHIKDSLGLAAEAGLDWNVDGHWLVNASIWRAMIKADATVDTALGKTQTSITLNPWVYMVAVGYKF